MSGYQWRVLALCFLIVAMDGLDTAVIGFVAPVTMHDWSVSRAAFGPVMSAAMVGLAIGALAAGPTADRVGRKIVLIGSVFCFGLFSLLCAFAESPSELMMLRFLTGLGSGAGGFVAASLIPQSGWRAVFLFGGILPIVSVPLMLWLTYFMGLLIIYLLTGWLPTLIKDAGLPVERAVATTRMFQPGGTVGAVAVGFAMDRMNRNAVIGTAYLLGGVFIFALGMGSLQSGLLPVETPGTHGWGPSIPGINRPDRRCLGG